MIVIDTETTGLLSSHLLRIERQPEVIELYAAELVEGTATERFNQLIKPKLPLPAEIIEITRIQQADVDKALPFTTYAAQIKALLEGADAVLAHNLSYDKEMLDLEFERLGQEISWPKRLVCSVEQTVHLLGYRLTLNALHEHLFGARFPEAHRAKNDVNALCRCVIELQKRGEL